MRRIVGFVVSILLTVNLTACSESNHSATWQEQYDLGIRCLSEGNYKEAIIAFTAAIEIDLKQAPAYIGRGQAYALSGQTEENLALAQEDFEKAILLDASNVDGYLGLADIYVQRGDYERAVEMLEDALGKTNNNQAIADKLDELTQLQGPEITDDGIVAFDNLLGKMRDKDYRSLFISGQMDVSMGEEYLIATPPTSLWFFRGNPQFCGLCYDGNGFSVTYSGIGLKVLKVEPVPVFYYGSLDSGRASGEGAAFSGSYWSYDWSEEDPVRYVLYEGTWANDKPNGHGVYTDLGSGTDGNQREHILDGNWANGFLDGEVVDRQYVAGIVESEFHYTCSQGRYVLDDRWEEQTQGNYVLPDVSGRKINKGYQEDWVWKFLN